MSDEWCYNVEDNQIRVEDVSLPLYVSCLDYRLLGVEPARFGVGRHLCLYQHDAL